MCNRCKELDRKISHYRRVAISTTDELTLRGIKKLIEWAEREKRVLHPVNLQDRPALSRRR
jgi:hypothetical protein